MLPLSTPEDSMIRSIAPVSMVAGGDNTTTYVDHAARANLSFFYLIQIPNTQHCIASHKHQHCNVHMYRFPTPFTLAGGDPNPRPSVPSAETLTTNYVHLARQKM
jgi:hypothetical protein